MSNSIRETNTQRMNALRKEIENLGVVGVARKYGVNHYYTSMIKANPDYIPKSEDVCDKLGIVVYRYTRPSGTPREYNRCTIYPGTPIAKVERMLREVTGIEWQPMIDELEY